MYSRYLTSLVLRELPPEKIKTVADLGCGVGLGTVQLATHFTSAKVSGFDFSQNGISIAKKHWKDIPNLDFSTKDITGGMNETYDLICAFEVLEHIADWHGMVDKIMLLSDKYILFSFPTGRMRPHEPKVGHVRSFKKHEVEEYMLTKGWTPVKVIYAGFPFLSPILRDLTNLLFGRGAGHMPQKPKMAASTKFAYRAIYISLRYFSSKRVGDQTFLLFKK